MKNFEELKTEAIRRGIVPGAVIECANDGVHGTVADYSEWKDYKGYPIVGKDRNGNFLYAYRSDKWAKVITPAPTQQPDTLQPGDACECSEAMQVAIMEMSRSFSIEEHAPVNDAQRIGVKFTEAGTMLNNCYKNPKNNIIDEWEFIRRLKNMAPPLKMLGDHVYTIEDGHVIADGNKIPFEHIHKLNAEILNLK